jgi:hypothetical protein
MYTVPPAFTRRLRGDMLKRTITYYVLCGIGLGGVYGTIVLEGSVAGFLPGGILGGLSGLIIGGVLGAVQSFGLWPWLRPSGQRYLVRWLPLINSLAATLIGLMLLRFMLPEELVPRTTLLWKIVGPAALIAGGAGWFIGRQLAVWCSGGFDQGDGGSAMVDAAGIPGQDSTFGE